MSKTAPRNVMLQRRRLQMTMLAVTNTSLQAAVLGLYAWAGEVAWSIVMEFLLAGAGSSAIFSVIIWRGWNLTFKDEGMLAPQIIASAVVQLIFLVLAPQLWFLFVFALFVTYNFAMMSFGQKQFAWSWILMGAALGVAFMLGRGRFSSMAPSTDLSLAILWLFLLLCIRQLGAIGLQFSALRRQLSEKNRLLSDSVERIQELANHDELTGVLNRRSFMEFLSNEMARAQRSAQPFTVALFDIDHFKLVNDRFGHLVGDAVLKEFCRVASAELRVSDRFGRYGGEEFIVLLSPVAPVESGLPAIERIRTAIERHDWNSIAAGLNVTMSAGLAEYAEGRSIKDIVDLADKALYLAKQSGRNRTIVHSEIVDPLGVEV